MVWNTSIHLVLCSSWFIWKLHTISEHWGNASNPGDTHTYLTQYSQERIVYSSTILLLFFSDHFILFAKSLLGSSMEVKKIYLYSLFAFGPDHICGQKSSVEMKVFGGEIFKNNLHLQINCIFNSKRHQNTISSLLYTIWPFWSCNIDIP